MKPLSFNNVGLCAFVAFLLCFEVSNAKTKRPKVTIPQGTLEGVTLETRNNRSIYGFRGIPYAQAPVGDLKFKEPVPAGGWNGTLDAGSDGSPCIQTPSGVVFGSEDCLYINVYTPKLPKCNASRLLPVVVYIHGGLFLWGSNDYYTYNPTYLLDKDILYVVPNYRLGALGFLSTGDEVAPGNWGLKDQILALMWVQNNIRYFGGDPDRVTLMGQSAGSIPVEILSITNLTEGLFSQYITQSGRAISTMAIQTNPIKIATQLAENFGCATANTSILIIECLKNVTATEITAASTLLLEWQIYPIITLAPVVEPNIEGTVLTDTPLNLLKKGNIRDIPAIKGWDREDGFIASGILYANPTLFEEFLELFDTYLPFLLNYHNTFTNVSAVTSALKSYYFNNDLTTNRTELLANLTLLAGDAFARFPIYETVRRDSSSNKPWYVYSFDYRGALSFGYVFSGGLDLDFIVCHGDGMVYLSDVTNSSFFASINKTMSGSDYQMVTEMVELWTSFIIKGVPHSSALGNASWPRYSTSKQYLRIGSGAELSLEVATSDFQDRLEFWNHLIVLMYEQ